MSIDKKKNFPEASKLAPLAMPATLAGVDSSPALATASASSDGRRAPQCFGLHSREVIAMGMISAVVLLASYRAWWAIGVAEAWGFVTGGICVWLVVREHVWNWPVGLVNNVFFFVLFLRGRLYADMALQLVYLGLGIYGWLNWIFGGQNRTTLRIGRATRSEWFALIGAIPVGTWGLMGILIKVNDAAPFLDALTTTLSLAAQYLLCRKRFENWFFWIAADVIYVPLYLSRKLPLTAVLYGVFLCMCLVGVREWQRTLRAKPAQP